MISLVHKISTAVLGPHALLNHLPGSPQNLLMIRNPEA